MVLRPVMMLSSVVMPRNRAMFWNVRAIPSRAASSVRIAECGWPL
jgi:hypothetical protein